MDASLMRYKLIELNITTNLYTVTQKKCQLVKKSKNKADCRAR